MVEVVSQTEQLVEKLIKDRRYLHEHPELSGIEFETGKYIKERLESLEITILDYKFPNVIGYIKGKVGKKTLALRADIDALPIVEEGDKPYLSKNHGVAHVCGHDGHTAVLLAVSEWIAQNQDEIEPNILLIFQSSEEITPSGAEALVRDGILENVDEIYGIHLWQGLKKGKIGLTYGPMMASADDFEITIEGSGGHGSMPQDTVDPIYIATHVIQALQSIVSRNLNPVHPSVISVGRIEAGTAYNIIPNNVKLYGTVRGLTLDDVTILRQQMLKLTAGICASFGAKGSVRYIIGTPPLVNHPEQSKYIEKVIRTTFGDDTFELVEPVMGGEDFAYYLLKKPGSFIFVGMGGEKSKYPHHHPRFEIDEDVLPNAVKLFIEIIKNYQ
ncbi:M20 metallopeptidase family protein [Litchfieldia alkalitelluris]|uniref:M20 metallopeptidase family protein n=1 Tax=Litchfieldia alkalitelluris TaxID=304268 RepID=UPI002E2733AA|nr:amidohydrolase [Litchfieldia alkalitelluris]